MLEPRVPLVVLNKQPDELHRLRIHYKPTINFQQFYVAQKAWNAIITGLAGYPRQAFDPSVHILFYDIVHWALLKNLARITQVHKAVFQLSAASSRSSYLSCFSLTRVPGVSVLDNFHISLDAWELDPHTVTQFFRFAYCLSHQCYCWNQTLSITLITLSTFRESAFEFLEYLVFLWTTFWNLTPLLRCAFFVTVVCSLYVWMSQCFGIGRSPTNSTHFQYVFPILSRKPVDNYCGRGHRYPNKVRDIFIPQCWQREAGPKYLSSFTMAWCSRMPSILAVFTVFIENFNGHFYPVCTTASLRAHGRLRGWSRGLYSHRYLCQNSPRGDFRNLAAATVTISTLLLRHRLRTISDSNSQKGSIRAWSLKFDC